MIRGQRTPTKAPREQVKVPLEARIHNRFDFEVRDARTGEIKQRAYAENIILDAYWTRIFAGSTANVSVHVGTGTGTLAASRTSLFTFLAAKALTDVEYSGNHTEGWISLKRTAQWSELENQNTAWTEVGVAYGSTSTNLTTHALIKDQNGNAVTLNKGTTDIITVYATIYAYLGASGFQSGTVCIPYPEKITAETVQQAPAIIAWMLGVRSSLPANYATVLRGDILAPKSPADSLNYIVKSIEVSRSGNATTKKLTLTMTRLAAASGNVAAGIKGILLASEYDGDGYRTDLHLKTPATWYPYSTITAESIGTGDGSALDFKTAFPFVKNDGSFVLYKNGVVVNAADYTVDFGIPNHKEIGIYLKVLDYDNNAAIPYGCEYSSAMGGSKTGYCLLENPYYASYGINSIHHGYSKISSSPDNVNWTVISDRTALGNSTITVTSGHENDRYWKIEKAAASGYHYKWYCTALDAKKNIHFGTGKAPANGDTITADYRTDVIAKDANHVFDLVVEITLQEKTT